MNRTDFLLRPPRKPDDYPDVAAVLCAADPE